MSILETLKEKFGAEILNSGDRLGEASVRVAPESLLKVCDFVKNGAGFTMFIDVLGVHWPQREQELDVVIHVRNPETMEFLRIKVATAKECPSVTAIWPGANWCEREAFDLFGIHFTGHPDLTRIYMPDDYPVHPMRKEIPLEGINATFDGDFKAFPQKETEDDVTAKRNLG